MVDVIREWNLMLYVAALNRLRREPGKVREIWLYVSSLSIQLAISAAAEAV
jgi:hypothetical protein